MSDKEIIEFFDAWAPQWDERMVINEEIIEIILNCSKVETGKDVLDVACGTGVMIPFYQSRNVKSITGIDISPEMVKIAKRKFEKDGVKFICANAASYDYEKKYDCIIIYNAFPHFDEPEQLIKRLSNYLRPGGTLSVCHGMSREKINEHHKNVSRVSHLLPEAEQLKELMGRYLKVSCVISDEKMYLVCGIRE